jgi:EAL domain-containing protein (putative c-di-GMP-specific phosphodiesterase class I)
MSLLRHFGCDMAQGFFLGHPSPQESITAMLSKTGSGTAAV